MALKYLAVHDRPYIQSRIREEIARGKRHGHPFALLVFEEVPASDGISTHKKMEYGLEALRRVARIDDVVARAFDDTIVVLLVETDARGAKDALLRMRNRLAQGAGWWQVTTYQYPLHGAAIEALTLLSAA
jgi:GGDEF domain-containing protein